MPLFAFGSNGSGQLGLGHEEDVSFRERCLFEEDGGDDNARVVKIVAGGNHTLILCEGGEVYAAGYNGDGRCGGCAGVASGDKDGTDQVVTRFRRVVLAGHRTFTGVAATWEGSVLVASSDGRSHGHGVSGTEGEGEEEQEGGGRDCVFVLGSGLKGELGLGVGCLRAEAGVVIPNFPPSGTRVVAVASGMGHTVVVLSDGGVWGWGAARKGQLGEALIKEKMVWTPVKIEGLGFKATGAACGREFTVVMGDRAKGEFAVLGSVDDKWRIRSGMPASETVAGYRAIGASWHGVYVHLNNGEVLAWGRNDRGQLPSDGLGKVKDLAVGSEHVLARLDDRTVVACGWGEHGNCGPGTDAQGNVKDHCQPIPLPDGESNIVGVGAGCATSWIITS